MQAPLRASWAMRIWMVMAARTSLCPSLDPKRTSPFSLAWALGGRGGGGAVAIVSGREIIAGGTISTNGGKGGKGSRIGSPRGGEAPVEPDAASPGPACRRASFGWQSLSYVLERAR